MVSPVSVLAPFTVKVEEALKGPATLRLAATEDEAVEIKPPKVVSPVSVLTPVTDRVEALTCPITVEEAVEIKPPRVDSPEIVAAPETVSVPPVVISVPMVDE